jgi:transcriptional regulator with XRE-family HTH domain
MPTFGERLRELRRAKNISQRDLASRIDVDFTYLSKIENDRMPPPSAKAIAALARELGADADELSILAGKIPSDLVDVLTSDPSAVKMFRSLTGNPRLRGDWERLLREQTDKSKD